MPISYSAATDIRRQDKVHLPTGIFTVAGKIRRPDGRIEVTYVGGRIGIIEPDMMLKVEKGAWSKSTAELPGYMKGKKVA